MKYIELTQDKRVMIDDGDFELVNQYKWCVRVAKHTYYAQAHIPRDGGRISTGMHRLILGLKPGDGKQGDHINHCGLDNRRSNLRIVTLQQNHFNQLSYENVSSKFKGVCWHKRKRRWVAGIKYNNKLHNLGRFNNEADAARAYDAKAKELFGEYAYLNFPDSQTVAERERC